MNELKKIYHVGPKNLKRLESLLDQLDGDEELACREYLKRWPDSGNLWEHHAGYIHCFATIEEARAYLRSIGFEGHSIYEIDATQFDERELFIDRSEEQYSHPVLDDIVVMPGQFREMAEEARLEGDRRYTKYACEHCGRGVSQSHVDDWRKQKKGKLYCPHCGQASVWNIHDIQSFAEHKKFVENLKK